jgi:hypothetical protein
MPPVSIVMVAFSSVDLGLGGELETEGPVLAHITSRGMHQD